MLRDTARPAGAAPGDDSSACDRGARRASFTGLRKRKRVYVSAERHTARRILMLVSWLCPASALMSFGHRARCISTCSGHDLHRNIAAGRLLLRLPHVQQPGSRRCLTTAAAVAPLTYNDDMLVEVLRDCTTIAMVGASPKWQRPSFFAMKYLQQKGFRVIPINPVVPAGQVILGEECYPSLSDLPLDLAKQITMVDIFRNSEAAAVITDEAIETLHLHGELKCVWMQLGVRNDDAAARATAAGLHVVMDRCPKIEFSRLFGELGTHGIDTGVISSRRRYPGRPPPKGRRPCLELGGTAGFETRAIHAGAAPDPSSGARGTPIHQSTAYVFDDVDHAASLFNLQTFGNVYGRLSNPTTAILEERLASLEGGRGATCTASGHSAQLLALFALMKPGDILIAANRLYGGSITQFGRSIQRFGWECVFVDTDDLPSVETALAEAGDRCKAVWCESIANPGGSVTDLAPLADVAHGAGVPLIVDNTMATPFLTRPFEHGADVICHSTTKFLSGHGNAMGGVVIDSGRFNWGADGTGERFSSLCLPEPAYHGISFYESFGDLALTTYLHAVGLRDLGPTMSPMNAYLTLCGVETLPLRMERHVQNATTVAEFLNGHPAVAWVSHASQPTSPYHARVSKYCPAGPGSVFTIGLHGGYEAGMKVVESVNLFSHLANIGDTRSLILHPASTTHRQLTPEQREACGAGDNTLRLSIGLESVDDLIADLDFALSS